MRWRLREGDVNVRSTAGHPFEDVDLSDGDWADYVEADAPASFIDIETKVACAMIGGRAGVCAACANPDPPARDYPARPAPSWASP